MRGMFEVRKHFIAPRRKKFHGKDSFISYCSVDALVSLGRLYYLQSITLQRINAIALKDQLDGCKKLPFTFALRSADVEEADELWLVDELLERVFEQSMKW